jgi:hypothetical protein
MVALALASVAICAVGLREWASNARIVALVLGAQAGWHLVLSMLAGHGVASSHHGVIPSPGGVPLATPPLDSTQRSGSFHDAYEAMAHNLTPVAPASSGPEGAGRWPHLLEHLLDQNPLMVVAHLAGAVVLGAFVAHGERALCAVLTLALVRILGATRGTTVSVAVVAPCTRIVSSYAGGAIRLAARLARTLPRRGPPARGALRRAVPRTV